YLIPQGFATMATPSAVKVLEENLRQRAKKEEQVINEAKKNAELLAAADVKIKAKTADGGKKLFGSITNANLADTLNEMGYQVDKKFVSINGGSAKTIGDFDAVIRLHREVTVTVNFTVIAE